MHLPLLSALALAYATNAYAAQSPLSRAPVPRLIVSPPLETRVSSGCPEETRAGVVTGWWPDNTNAPPDRLRDTHDRTVTRRRLKIVGGLVPSATVAAQAGAIDPAKASVAADPMLRAGTMRSPDIHVIRVSSRIGVCNR